MTAPRPHDVLLRLLELELLTPARVVAEGVRITERTRRHTTYVVEPDRGTGYLVKAAAAGPERPGTARYEAAVLDVLAGSRTAATLGGRLAPLVGVDPDLGLIVIGLIPSTGNVREHHHRGHDREEPLSVSIAAAIGATLATVHASGREFASAPRSPLARDLPQTFALTLPHLDMLTGSSAGMQDLLRFLHRTPELREPLDALAGSWSSQTLIHGDPRWDNWLLRAEELGADLAAPVALVDWEFATIGDPGWDLGVALGDYLAAWVMGTPELPGAPLARGAGRSRYPLAAVRTASRSLWSSYVETATLLGDPALTPSPERTARFVGARLVQLAGEQMHRSTRLTPVAGGLLQLAANVFAAPGRAATHLLDLTIDRPAATATPSTARIA